MNGNHLLLERLKTGVLLLDGGMGTELQKRGIRGNTALGNVEAPAVIEEIHQAYLEAGADILETNTFAGSRFALGRDDKNTPEGDLVRKYDIAGVDIARKVASRRPDVFVAGSIGPIGKVVYPFDGSDADSDLYLPRELAYNLFKEQAEVIGEGGVDFCLIETMIDLKEAMLALKAAKDTGLITAVSFNLGKGHRTPFGNRIEDIVRACEEGGAEIIGVNCIPDMPVAVEVARELRAVTSRPLIVYPNAGIPDARGVHPDQPAYMAGYIEELIEAGANIIGGCCGTTPAHIQAFRESIDRFGGMRT